MSERPDHVPPWMNWPTYKIPARHPSLVFAWFCLAVPTLLGLVVAAVLDGSALDVTASSIGLALVRGNAAIYGPRARRAMRRESHPRSD